MHRHHVANGPPEPPVLRVEGLTIQLGTRRGKGIAVDGVGFDLKKGRTLGLIGESGSGKSLTAMALLDLLQKNVLRITGGRIEYDGKDLVQLDAEARRAYRGRHISMVLQDPLAALNPVLTVRDQLFEALRLHHGLKGAALRARAVELLRLMRIPSPDARLEAYPHEMSGGMRQRVVGAIALAGDPAVLVADEPTTALDVTVQAAYLELLKKIQAERGMAILFITHDFAVVGEICDEVAVMYAGRIVEKGTTAEVFGDARHPYTKALLKAVPDITEKPRALASIPGTPPSVFAMPPGCRFHPRCWLHKAMGCPSRCREEAPADHATGPGRTAACHFTEEAAASEPAASRGDDDIQ
ncbi:ABC transporter ATP-binding protein [Antarctobacter sp.]|uniref:ABC transporter ATP-binding protein n=1 Tax=Antarctobacter sp. TaxID=1872577 RepID=UPI003A91EB94